MENILVVHKLNKAIGKDKILRNVSFSVPKGKICAFIGPNGAGKTTTIKSIMGLFRYNSGEITVNGLNTKKIASHKFIGYVPEKENFPKVKARSFIRMMASLSGMKRRDIKTEIKYYERVFDIKNRLHINLNSMSSGQKKKVMIIQSLIHDPELIIMDEPTENLDPDTRDTFYKLMNKLKKCGKSIFISTHNLDEIQNYADYIVVLIHGQVKIEFNHQRGVDLHRVYNKYKDKVRI
ncbi:MAG: ABC transporter ATP-binding protein [Mycoplasmataceae bacterium]|jgi:ABC-2 type transport system ATP-binding protein|nr:ABC transporter ATP-binding protein [Mycoplasmataceae bacterium]